MATALTNKELRAKLPGAQLAVFETVWPAFEQLDELLIRVHNGALSLYCRFSEKPGVTDMADCERLVREVLEMAFEAPSVSFEFGVSKPSERYDQLMSAELFTAIAKQVAPWRLQAGR